MADFPNHSNKPASFFAAVVPSDTVPLAQVARALFVGTGGNIAVVGTDGNAVVFKNVGNGAVLPLNATRVNASLTTASDIVALF